MTRPRLLIEEGLPISEIGIESQRERSASSALPPLYFLHVWWARRPLTTSRAAILGSLLPSWDGPHASVVQRYFEDRGAYEAWFKVLCGILGDPVEGRKRILRAKLTKEKLKDKPYKHPRAFTVNPSPEDLEILRQLLEATWGTGRPMIADPMAGGGSIPFEALRYGLPTHANELNPVAAVILHATLDFPFRFGSSLTDDLRRWGGEVTRRVEEALDRFFPRRPGESIFAYLWARTVRCPTTGKPVPLSPNWWLQKGDSPVAVWLVADPAEEACRFEIVRGREAQAAHPDEGTVKGGVGRSPWTGEAIPQDYIKAEAQAGRMGQQLYALGVKRGRGTEFRPPTEEDLAAAQAAEAELARRLPAWEAAGLVPREEIPRDINDPRPIYYGMPTWADLFSPRQLLTLVTYLETVRQVGNELASELDAGRARAVSTYLALMLDKAVDRNSVMTRWITQRQVVANTFDRHDFSFKWSYAEFDGAHNLWSWVVDQVTDAYAGLTKLAGNGSRLFAAQAGPPIVFTSHNAVSVPEVPTGSVHLVCVDPPYYDNVMYGELSDFFYVWQKRSLGHLYPDLFRDLLTNKDEEAVANPARFASVAGRKRRELAERDYERKMAACFAEMRRMLADDGVLLVMFTHKRVEAWNALATALIQAGFMVETSWPVHTEFEHSLHQAKKNAAQSTILLACRKRPETAGPVWWDDIKGLVRTTARERAEQFQQAGISGVDLYLATFGPVLSVISSRWPVLTGEVDEETGEPRVLRPDAALDLARREVVELRKQGLLLGRAIEFDRVTDWYLMAWDAFRAEQFPADEARKLAIVLDLELERELVQRRRVVTKKQAMVAFLKPTERRRDGMVDPDLLAFGTLLDAVHTAMLVYTEEGDRACEAFLRRTGLLGDARFRSCLNAMLQVIPRSRSNGRFLRPEAELLEAFRLRWFDDLEVPPDEDSADAPRQATLDEAMAEGGGAPADAWEAK